MYAGWSRAYGITLKAHLARVSELDCRAASLGRCALRCRFAALAGAGLPLSSRKASRDNASPRAGVGLPTMEPNVGA